MSDARIKSIYDDIAQADFLESLKPILEKYLYLKDLTQDERFKVIKKALENNAFLINDVSYKNTSSDFLKPGDYFRLAEIALQNGFNSMVFIDPDSLTTEEYKKLCLQAISYSYTTLRYINIDKVGKEFYSTIANQFINKLMPAKLLPYIAGEYFNPEEYQAFCKKALEQDNSLLKYADPRFLPSFAYEAFCITCVDDNIYSFKDVNPNYLSEDTYINLCAKAYVINDNFAKFIPEDINPAFAMAIFTKLLSLDHSSYATIISNGYLDRFDSQTYSNLCEQAVKYNSDYLTDIDPDKLTNEISLFDLCKLAIDKHGNIQLLLFDEIHFEPALDQEYYKTICQLIIAKNGTKLADVDVDRINDSEFYFELCKLSTKDRFMTLGVINDIHFDVDDQKKYKILCQSIIENNGLELKNVDTKRINDPAFYKKLIEVALHQNGLAYVYIDFDVLLPSFSDEREAFQYVYRISEIAFEANPDAIKFMDNDDLKRHLLEKADLEMILTKSPTVVKYFPKDPPQILERANKFLNELLKRIENVVVVGKEDWNDPEVKDSYQVYSTKEFPHHPVKSRKNKTILVETNKLESTLNQMESFNNNNSVNLVLLSHFSVGANEISEMKISEIVKVLREHGNINKVTLLGCYTASAKKFDKEIDIEKQRLAKQADLVNIKCGFAIMSELPTQGDIQKILGAYLDASYVLIKNKQNKDLFQLIYVGKNTDVASLKSCLLNEEQVQALAKAINKNKAFKEPGKNLPIIPIVDKSGKPQAFSPNQQEKIVDIASGNLSRYSRAHLQYRQQKETTPFLQNINIDINDEEMIKLNQEKFMAQLAHAINDDPEIKQEVVLKGYPGILSVDVRERGFSISHERVYRDYPRSFFNDPNADPIKRDVQAKDRENMLQYTNQDETSLKSISITIPQKKS